MVGELRLRRKQTAPGVIHTQIPTPHQYPINNKQSGGDGRPTGRGGGPQKGEEKLTSIDASFVALELICTKCAYFS